MALRFAYGNHIDNDDFVQAFTNGTAMGHVDIKRLRAGSSGGAFWSVFAPCPKDGDDFSDDNYAASGFGHERMNGRCRRADSLD